MSDRDDDNQSDPEEGTDLGPKSNTDDSTMSDAGLIGTPASTASPVGQGDEPGPGADDERDGSQDDDERDGSQDDDD